MNMQLSLTLYITSDMVLKR